MEGKNFMKKIFWLIFLIFGLNFLAMKFYWYSSIWYFDMITHFLGGVFLAWVFIYLWSIFFKKEFNIFFILAFVLLIGGLWEFFEFSLDTFITLNKINILDTTSDLFFDLAGGLLGFFSYSYYNYRVWKIKK